MIVITVAIMSSIAQPSMQNAHLAFYITNYSNSTELARDRVGRVVR